MNISNTYNRAFGNSRFATVSTVKPNRSVFDRSANYSTTFDAGYLVPFCVDEVLPGDTFSVDVTAMIRMSTPLRPINNRLVADVHWFFAPNRLQWTNWEKFNGAQDDPGDSTDFMIPQMTSRSGGYDPDNDTESIKLNGKLADYFGLPTKIGSTVHNALIHRSYNHIYNEFYRDQNLIDSVYHPKDDGPDTADNYKLLKRAKRHDYFTSCLPWPQKGDSVDLPLGTTAPLIYSGSVNSTQTIHNYSTGSLIDVTTLGSNASGEFVDQSDTKVAMKLNDSHFVDLSSATAATVNQLRQAFQMQKMLEKDARGGTRYTEILRAHFGVISPDFRLQRPEYLGGGSVQINSYPVAKTSSTDGDDIPLGELGAYALGLDGGKRLGFTRSFTEHGHIIGIVSVRSDLTYQDGMHKMWSRRVREDFYLPVFAHLGEQAVLNSEIYYTKTSTDADVFGYQERWAEYRYKPSLVTGLFRSNATGSLDYWHLAQDFGSLQTLNQTFIEETPPMARVKNVEDAPDFLMDSVIKMKCARVMPVFSRPGMIDHF